MVSIGSLRYDIIADTQKFQTGIVATRRELSAAKRLFLETRTPAESLGVEMDGLGRLFQKGAIDAKTFARAARDMGKGTEEAIAAQQKIIKSLRDEANAIKAAAKESGKLTLADQAKVTSLRQAATAAEEEAARLQELADAEERAARESREQAEAQARHAEALRMAADLVRRNETETQRLNRQYDEAFDLLQRGVITSNQYRQEIDRLEKTTASHRQRTDAAKEAERARQAVMARGAATTRRHETATERFNRELQDLRRELQAGAITIETYRRASDRLEKELAASRKQAMGLKKDLLGVSTNVKTLVKGFIAFQATRGAINTVAAELERIDEIAKTSRKLGIDSSDLVALRLAGEQLAGMATGQLDTALQRMTRRIAEAAKGAGEAKSTIEGLGFDPKQLSTRGPVEAFRLLSDAVRETEDESEQLRIAFKLFDSEGADVVNIMKQGGDAVDLFREKTQRLGLTFTDDVARNVEQTKDALSDARNTFRGAASDFTTFLTPAINAAADSFSFFASKMREAQDKSRRLGEELAKWWMGSDLPETIGATTRVVKEQSIASNAAAQATIADSQVVSAAIDDEIQSLREKAEMIGLNREEMERYKLSQKGATDEQMRQLELVQEQRRNLERFEQKDREREEKARRQQAEFESMAEKIAANLKSPFDQLVQDLAELELLVSVGAIDEETANREEQRLREEQKARNKPVEVALPPAAQRGSREEFAALAQINKAVEQADDRRHKEQIEEMRLNREVLERVEELLADLELPEPV